jgi:hypothetical protein
MATAPPRLRVRPPGRFLLGPLAAVLIALAAAHASPAAPSHNHVAPAVQTFEQRAAVEKASRSRYRNLEVASLVLILAAGGAAIWWTFRKR